MSNATESSRPPGSSKRRRSRGGKNRNRSRNDNESGHQGGNRHDSARGQSQSRTSSQGSRSPRTSYQAKAPAPAPKLTLWQKLLKAVGLYKEPAQPFTRNTAPIRTDERPPKSNTRNARTAEAREPKAAREPREPREKKAREPRERRGGDASTVVSSRVYVGNLSYEATEEDLRELFKGIGTVRNVEIVYNRSTHRSKGYGFVEMLAKEDAERSVEVLHDQPFMGRNITVSGAKSRGQDEREDEDAKHERPERPVVVAPLPAAAAPAEATIETVVENVSETVAEPVVAEAVAEAEAAESSDEEPRNPVA
jgi:hypothetical protein